MNKKLEYKIPPFHTHLSQYLAAACLVHTWD